MPEDPNDIKVICMVCDTYVRGNPQGKTLSHGLCPTHADLYDRMLAGDKRAEAEFLKLQAKALKRRREGK